MISKKPRKQRKRAFNAPLHKKQKMMGSHLSKEMRAQVKRKTIAVRKGDEVKVMRGKFKGTSGKITKVLLKHTLVYIDSVKRKKVNGEEIQVGIHPSNLIVINLDTTDSKRLSK